MSVRKLTNVQKARRVLLERRNRCLRATALPIDDILTSGYQRDPITNLEWNPKDIGKLVRLAVRTGDIAQLLQTARSFYHSGGSKKFVRGVVPDPIHAEPERWVASRNRPAGVDLTLLSPRGNRYWFIHPCPCTPRERVAVDTLLEYGDKHAERLAIACARGGGILEGASKKGASKKRRRR